MSDAPEAPPPEPRPRPRGFTPETIAKAQATRAANRAARAAVKPEPAAAPAADAPTRRKTKGPVKPPSDSAIKAIAQQCYGGHLVAAQVLGIPELAITEAQALALTGSIATTAAQFGFDVEAAGGKFFALLGLIATIGMIYVPRVQAIQARINAARRGAQSANTSRPPNGVDVTGPAPLAPEAQQPHIFETMPRQPDSPQQTH